MVSKCRIDEKDTYIGTESHCGTMSHSQMPSENHIKGTGLWLRDMGVNCYDSVYESYAKLYIL